MVKISKILGEIDLYDIIGTAGLALAGWKQFHINQDVFWVGVGLVLFLIGVLAGGFRK